MSGEKKWMEKALALAASVKGSTYPNPAVGAVLVKNGKEIASAATQIAGLDHAEAACIKKAHNKAAGSVMYVTLEPCSHFGKTPPCADAIINASIKKVYCATGDPNPQVNGKGLQKLKENGITVNLGLLEKQAIELNREFFNFIQKGRPYITIKYAMTLDGKIACDNGSSRWITGEHSRQIVHELRKENHAVMVGAQTIRKDNPSLDCRLEGVLDAFQPKRVVISASANLEAGSTVFNNKQETLVITTNKGAEKLKLNSVNANFITLPTDDFAPAQIADCLGKNNITSILIEGGQHILTDFIKHKMFDRILVFIAPKIIGGIRYSPVGELGLEYMEDALNLQGKWSFAGNDVYFEGLSQ